ncbi:MAG TPA: HK97-gp10 family putative phage morphogenesis protein [Actinoplanes sp.]|nr:HK97-gp10 family putative phage morphogenesis protein [Actinoplanes sp.]
MVVTVQVKVISNRLPQASAKVRSLTQQAISETAFQIQADAQALAPVRTGTLRRSILAQIGSLSARIGSSVHYAIYVEMGTRRMGARPYLRPAAEKNLKTLVTKLTALLRGL